MENMSDDQLRDHIAMLRNNKEMARAAFANRPGGGPVDDAQLDMMLNMMNPEMMHMSMNFAKANPDLVKQQMQGGIPGGAPPPQPSAAREETKQAAGSASDQIDSSSQPAGAPPAFDPSNPPDMAAMANNPMFKEMMNNPEMMKMAMNMMNGGQGQGGGMPDPSAMQDMMKNPSMQNLLSNPEMLT